MATEDLRKQANLRLLQRSIDSNIEDIVGSATHVVLYEYVAPQGWEKLQVEGSLFLVSQQPYPVTQYSMAILNRHSTENFQVEVTKAFQLQHKDPYLIFKQSHKILGIWFHNANERVVMASLLNKVLENLRNAPIVVPTPPPAQRPPQPQQQQPQFMQQQQQGLPPQLFQQQQQQPQFSSGTTTRQVEASPMSQFQQQLGTPTGGSSSNRTQPSPSALIEPLMNTLFLSPTSNTDNNEDNNNNNTAGAAAAANHNNTTPGGSSGGTDTPTRTSTPTTIPGVALDKKSLQLALLSLIQDDRFIDLLHAQYLKVAHARAHRNNKK